MHKRGRYGDAYSDKGLDVRVKKGKEKSSQRTVNLKSNSLSNILDSFDTAYVCRREVVSVHPSTAGSCYAPH